MNIVAVLANYTLVSLGSPGTRLAGDNPRSEVVNSEQQDLCIPAATSLISQAPPGWLSRGALDLSFICLMNTKRSLR